METNKILKSFGFKNVIGSDVSLDVCINEGYLMLNKNGKFNYNACYSVFAFVPDYIMAKSNETEHSLITNTSISVVEAIEIYKRFKLGIDSFIGDTHSTNKSDYKSYYDLLSLCDSINPYCGLN